VKRRTQLCVLCILIRIVRVIDLRLTFLLYFLSLFSSSSYRARSGKGKERAEFRRVIDDSAIVNNNRRAERREERERERERERAEHHNHARTR